MRSATAARACGLRWSGSSSYSTCTKSFRPCIPPCASPVAASSSQPFCYCTLTPSLPCVFTPRRHGPGRQAVGPWHLPSPSQTPPPRIAVAFAFLCVRRRRRTAQHVIFLNPLANSLTLARYKCVAIKAPHVPSLLRPWTHLQLCKGLAKKRTGKKTREKRLRSGGAMLNLERHLLYRPACRSVRSTLQGGRGMGHA